jgi:hypothetical protein
LHFIDLCVGSEFRVIIVSVSLLTVSTPPLLCTCKTFILHFYDTWHILILLNDLGLPGSYCLVIDMNPDLSHVLLDTWSIDLDTGKDGIVIKLENSHIFEILLLENVRNNNNNSNESIIYNLLSHYFYVTYFYFNIYNHYNNPEDKAFSLPSI